MSVKAKRLEERLMSGPVPFNSINTEKCQKLRYDPVFCSPDDFVLQVHTDIDEVITVSGHSDDEVSVFLRMLLGLAKRVGADNVELNMVTVKLEVGSDEVGDLIDSVIIGQKMRRKLLIEKGSASSNMVHLGRGLDDSRRAMTVGSLDR